MVRQGIRVLRGTWGHRTQKLAMTPRWTFVGANRPLSDNPTYRGLHRYQTRAAELPRDRGGALTGAKETGMNDRADPGSLRLSVVCHGEAESMSAIILI